MNEQEMVELAEVRAAERATRRKLGYCPDCDDLCEPWTVDGVSCGHDRSDPARSPWIDAAWLLFFLLMSRWEPRAERWQ